MEVAQLHLGAALGRLAEVAVVETADHRPGNSGSTTIPGGVDDHVKSIARTYDTLGRLTFVTSYANADGTGTVRNQLNHVYGSHGQVTASNQCHENVVGIGDAQSVQYAYDDSATSNVYDDGLRQETVTYPAGRVAFYGYGSTGSSTNVHDRLNRIEQIRETNSGGTLQTQYNYNGTSRLAETDLAVPDVRRQMFNIDSAGTNIYNGYDRFGRLAKNAWYDYTSGSSLRDRYEHEYDYAGNLLTADIHSSLTGGLDHRFYYDGLQRLIQYEQGTLSGTTLGSRNWQISQTLDQLGNWAENRMGNPYDYLDQDRYHNSVNEIDTDNTHGDSDASITASTGLNWADPVYDAAGNTTSIPDAYSPTTSLSLKYDAWNRLVEVKSGADTVQVNEFDGLGRRIVRVHWIASASATYDYYYNEDWQLLEEQKEGDADPLQQYLWHPYYIDALALRWYDADVSGDPVAEYYLHSANFHVSAVTNDSGTVIERYIYTPYGDYSTFNGSYSIQSGSQIGNTHFYTGRERDPETYLQLNRHRFYYSYLGRWLSRDPIEYGAGDPNLYGYVGAMPTYYVDPSGLVELHFHSCIQDCQSLNSPDRRKDCYDDCDRRFPPPPRFLANPGLGNAYPEMVAAAVFAAPGAAAAVGAEVVDTVIEETTGIPVIVSPTDALGDLGKKGIKRCFRKGNFPKPGGSGTRIKGGPDEPDHLNKPTPTVWGTEHPTKPDFDSSFGLPPESAGPPDWMMGGHPIGPVQVRPAPGSAATLAGVPKSGQGTRTTLE